MGRQIYAGGALSGYRVLDVSDEKGMFCARLLAGMGAEVIRVEKPGEGSPGDTFVRVANIGKLSITLDLESERGRELFKRLVETADILVESYQPGYFEALGLGHSELSRINQRLITASITNFGQNGPSRDYKSCDLVASALGGQMYICGEPETPPLKPFGNQAYYSAGLFAAIGILLALWHRHTTGRGQYLDVSVMECVAAMLDHVLVRYRYEGVVARRGNRYWNDAFRIFPCRDGYILLSLFQQWETLVAWLESEGMADDLADSKWRDREERLRGLDHIIDVLERWTLSHTATVLVERGQLMRFPWAEVASLSGLVSSPQLAERNYFAEIECLGVGSKYKAPGAPCKLSHSPWQIGDRVSNVGEHNLDIYHRELEISKPKMESLTREGTI